MSDFAQTLITAIAIGSLYALIALGYTMVYGILKFINFAHSDIVVLGAWGSYSLSVRVLPALGYGLKEVPPVWVALMILLLAMIFCGAIGFTIERLAYRPLRVPTYLNFINIAAILTTAITFGRKRIKLVKLGYTAPRLNVLITAIGVSLLLQNVGQLNFVFGASPQNMPPLLSDRALATFSFGEGESARQLVIGMVDVVIFATATSLLLIMQYLVFHTKLGVAMRAVSFNTDTAALMGIPVDRVVSFTFVLGSMLAAAAGFLIVMKYPSINQPAHTIWVLLGLKAFVAAVIGGIGNVRGAVLGGFVIAFVEQFGAFYVSSNYRDVYVFTLLILILLVKPGGLLGSTLREKV